MHTAFRDFDSIKHFFSFDSKVEQRIYKTSLPFHLDLFDLLVAFVLWYAQIGDPSTENEGLKTVVAPK